MRAAFVVSLTLAGLIGLTAAQEAPTSKPAQAKVATLKSIAIRTKNMKAMEAFYAGAFGATFTDARVGPFTCRFGKAGGLLIKLVPLRKQADFKTFPIHQMGLEVPDAAAFTALATKHGGKVIGKPRPARPGWVSGAVRDPDGNSIEFEARTK